MLLADIKAFEGRLESGAYVEGWGWDEDLHDERSFGDESWADEMDNLLGGAGAAWLEEIRARYPRHYAPRAEIDAAARQSPYLPSPVAKRLAAKPRRN